MIYYVQFLFSNAIVLLEQSIIILLQCVHGFKSSISAGGSLLWCFQINTNKQFGKTGILSLLYMPFWCRFPKKNKHCSVLVNVKMVDYNN